MVDTRYVNELTNENSPVLRVHHARLFIERALFSIRAAINALTSLVVVL